MLSAPSSAAIHTDIAAAYLVLGAAEDAAAHSARATAIDPSLGPAHYNLGNARFALGDAAAAADDGVSRRIQRHHNGDITVFQKQRNDPLRRMLEQYSQPLFAIQRLQAQNQIPGPVQAKRAEKCTYQTC